MSLIELFKQHIPKEHHHWFNRNQLADFYAGFYGHGMDVHMWSELHDCMESSTESEEALFMWGKAIEHLSRGEKADFKMAAGEAKKLSEPAMEGCKENGKYAVVSTEMGAWFYDFWTQDGAHEQMMENIEAHPFKVKFDIVAMRAQMALGFYYGAGSSYGRFWKHLMGKPTWSVDMSSPKMAPVKVDHNETAAAILNSNSFYTLTGMDVRKEW